MLRKVSLKKKTNWPICDQKNRTWRIAMVRNGKERENLDFSSVAATFEKANTYVFAERLIRNAEVRGSIPSAPPINCSVSKF
jgi:hypothetical protein